MNRDLSGREETNFRRLRIIIISSNKSTFAFDCDIWIHHLASTF